MDFSHIHPADLESHINKLDEIIAEKLGHGQAATLSSRLFKSFQKGAVKAQVTTNKTGRMIESLMEIWEREEKDRKWSKLLDALDRSGRKDLSRKLQIYLDKKGIDISTTVVYKEHADFIVDNICSKLSPKNVASFCVGLFGNVDPMDVAKEDAKDPSDDPHYVGLQLLRDWMHEAEPPAVNDLVHAVDKINATMSKELVSYLNDNFERPAPVAHDLPDNSTKGPSPITQEKKEVSDVEGTAWNSTSDADMAKEQPGGMTGSVLAGSVSQVAYKLHMDEINLETSKFVSKLNDQNCFTRPLIAIVDTGVFDDRKKFCRLFHVNTRFHRPRPACPHGTFVAQIICENNQHVDLLSVPISATGDYHDNDMVEGLRSMIQWETDNGRKVDVVNISMGHEHPSNALRDIIGDLAKDRVIICAGSNDGLIQSDTLLAPAMLEGSIAIGSYDRSGNRLKDSPQGDRMHSICPGVWYVDYYVPETGCWSERKAVQGTSFAAPFASAIAAHVLIVTQYFERYMNLSRNALLYVKKSAGMRAILKGMCTHPDTPNKHEGYGVLTPYSRFKYADEYLKGDLRRLAEEAKF